MALGDYHQGKDVGQNTAEIKQLRQDVSDLQKWRDEFGDKFITVVEKVDLLATAVQNLIDNRFTAKRLLQGICKYTPMVFRALTHVRTIVVTLTTFVECNVGFVPTQSIVLSLLLLPPLPCSAPAWHARAH